MEHEKQIEALIKVTCSDDTRFLTQKIINYSDYKSEGYQHLENMCVHINKMCFALRDMYAENKQLREAIAEVLSWYGGGESVGYDIQERLEQALKGTAE